MQIKLVSPFRIPFELPRDALLANHDLWIERIKELEPSLATSDFPNASLGNYAWSKLQDLRNDEDKIYGGKGGLNDPGWFFRSHYIMQTRSKFDLSDVFFTDRPEYKQIFNDNAAWECQLIDNTIAVITISISVKNLDLFCQSINKDAQAFFDATDALANTIIINNKDLCENLIQWIKENLFNKLKLDASDCNEKFLDESPPIYHELYKSVFWTHRAFCLTDECRKSLSNQNKGALTRLLSHDLAELWINTGGYGYGWGSTAIIENPNYDKQWLHALQVSQYYYACFDLVDTTLPVSISASRLQSQQGQHKRVLKYARKTHSKISTMINDYRDLKSRTSSEAYRGVKAYHENWRVDDLISSVNDKLSIYKEQIEVSSDSLNKKMQSITEIILFGITLLSLVGLIASLHDYLAGDYDPRLPEGLPAYAANNVDKDNLILISIFAVIIALVVYVLYVRWRK